MSLACAIAQDCVVPMIDGSLVRVRRSKPIGTVATGCGASVERSGALPVVLPTLGPEHAEALLERVDGLLLSGGVDVDPALYGRPRHPKLGRVDP